MSSITFGGSTAILMPFNSSAGVSIPTYAGDMDLDWFTDVSSFNYVGRYSALPIYFLGKVAWTIGRFGSGDKVVNAVPFQDPTERVAAIALLEDQNFGSLFTPEFFSAYGPGCDYD